MRNPHELAKAALAASLTIGLMVTFLMLMQAAWT